MWPFIIVFNVLTIAFLIYECARRLSQSHERRCEPVLVGAKRQPSSPSMAYRESVEDALPERRDEEMRSFSFGERDVRFEDIGDVVEHSPYYRTEELAFEVAVLQYRLAQVEERAHLVVENLEVHEKISEMARVKSVEDYMRQVQGSPLPEALRSQMMREMVARELMPTVKKMAIEASKKTSEVSTADRSPKRPPLQEAIKMMLEERPLASEEIRKIFAKHGVEVSTNAIQKACGELHDKKEIMSHMVMTPRYRMGVTIWSKNDERVEKISEFIAMLESEKTLGHKFG